MGEGKRLYFNEINIVKGIAMLTVIWHHSMIVYPINLQALTFTLQNVKVNTEYTIQLHDILLYYHNTQKTALQNLPATETTARKFIRNGQLLIEKDGVVYTATGVRL